MKTFVIVALLFLAAQAAPGSPAVNKRVLRRPEVFGKPSTNALKREHVPRIINGQVASHGQFPHQAALIFNNNVFCGGSLISTEWVLTAAHCVDGARSASVYLGAQNINANSETGRVVISSSTLFHHDDYNPNSLVYDVALIRLSQAVSLSEYIQTIELASGSDSYAGDTAIVSGWGWLSDNNQVVTDQLRYVGLEVMTNDDCQPWWTNPIYGGSICCDAAGGKTPCHGDSGGALTVNGIQVGIVSFVNAEGCSTGWPSVYSRVTFFRDWIRENSGV